MCTVSVIIPAFNAAAFVGEAISSALAQRNVDLEVLVIDDGSTDDTPQVLAKFAGAIRTCRQPNSGHIRARNAAAQLAQGEWLAFLDADDVWMPDKLEKQLALVDDRTDLIYTDRLFFGDISRVTVRQSDLYELPDGEVFEDLLLRNFITVSSVLMRKRRFEQLGGFDAEPFGSEDWDLWLRYAAAGGRIGVCREPLTHYRFSTNSMTSSKCERMTHGRLKVVERALQLPRSRSLRRDFVRRVAFHVWLDSAWYAASVLPWKAMQWYLCALRYAPLDPRPYKGLIKCALGRS